jgi:hypothetical protein
MVVPNSKPLQFKILKFIYNSPTAGATDLEILVVLVTKLLRQDLNRLVNGIEPVELWDEG